MSQSPDIPDETPPESLEDADHVRRKRVRFRCWHRGTKEADLLLGRFADAHVFELPEDRLIELEALLEAPDWDVYAWVCRGGAPAPFDTELMRQLQDFSRDNPL